MAPFPLPLTEWFGHWGAYIVYLFIGVAFGYVLEISGFGNSKKLAAQFYFKDMTVLKVMFSAIIVAMVLIFLATGLGLLDFNLIWVNPTYLWPGIIGGLIMGVGFIVGGFCPGTSLVAAATAKIDGVIFVLGVFFGIFLFGETVEYYEDFWFSSYMGRFTLPQLFGVNTAVVVLGVVIMALAAFWAAEKAEQYFGDNDSQDAKKYPIWRYGAAAALILVAAVGWIIGQPTTEERWDRMASIKEPLVAERAVQIHPGEMLDLIRDSKIKVMMLDVRDESDFNTFHIQDAVHAPLDELPGMIDELHQEPANTAFFTISNDETAATEAWRILQAESLPNVYILAGGINNWIEMFGDPEFLAEHPQIETDEDQLCFTFNSAVGNRYVAARPGNLHEELEYEAKVELEIPRGPASGGCG